MALFQSTGTCMVLPDRYVLILAFIAKWIACVEQVSYNQGYNSLFTTEYFRQWGTGVILVRRIDDSVGSNLK